MEQTRKQERQNKARGFLYDLGKFMVDIAKLAFGSLVLGTVIRWDIPQKTVFTAGVLFTVIIALSGLFISRANEEKKNG
jgi:cytochrome b subunit of formate dehydrogenase